MTNFTDIAAPGEPPVLIDLDEVTMVTQAENKVSLWSKSQGEFFQAPPAETKSILKAMRAAGIELLKFPDRHPPRTGKRTFFIRPEAVTYIAAAPIPEKGQGRFIRLGVEGLMTVASHAVTPAEEKRMLDLINRAKKTTLRLDGRQESGGFSLPGCKDYALIDTSKINRVEIISDKIYLHSSFRDGFFLEPKRVPDQTFNDRTRACRAFARAVAAKAPHLESFANANPPWFGRLNDVDAVILHKNARQLTLNFKNGIDQTLGSSEIEFKKPSDRTAAVEQFKARRNQSPR